MNKKAYSFFLKKNRKRKKPNPIAKALKFFTHKRFKDKTKYNREEDDQVWKRHFWRGI